MIALLGSALLAVPLAALFFGIGVAYERLNHDEARVFLLPSSAGSRHPAPHHRRPVASRRTHPTRHLRVVTPIFDFESQEDTIA